MAWEVVKAEHTDGAGVQTRGPAQSHGAAFMLPGERFKLFTLAFKVL